MPGLWALRRGKIRRSWSRFWCRAAATAAESAAPIARDVVKAYYDKKQGKFRRSS